MSQESWIPAKDTWKPPVLEKSFHIHVNLDFSIKDSGFLPSPRWEVESLLPPVDSRDCGMSLSLKSLSLLRNKLLLVGVDVDVD